MARRRQVTNFVFMGSITRLLITCMVCILHRRCGFCPYYLSGKWLWRQVEVLGYISEHGKYRVRFTQESAPKDVHRLNLRMNEESEVLFEKRREIAERSRTEAKSIMRFDHFVNMQPKVRFVY